jgi:hypothetical protein
MSKLPNQRHFFWKPLIPLESTETPEPAESQALPELTALPDLSIPPTPQIPPKPSKTSMPFIFSMPLIYPEPPKPYNHIHSSLAPKLPKHSKPTSPPKQPNEHNKDCSATLNEEICIEAKVTVNPEVSIGNVRIECLDSTIDRFPSCNKCSSEKCTVFVNQLIRVKIPIQFSAKADAEKLGVICRVDHQEDCTEESSCSKTSDW